MSPPSTPSPVKSTGRTKRVVADYESDDDNVFIPRCDICFFMFNIVHTDDFCLSPTQDSPKKARAKEPSTPSKISKTT